MRRSSRILLNLVTIASLLLLLAVLLTVIVSDFPWDQPWRSSSGSFGQPVRVLVVSKTEIQYRRLQPVGPGQVGIPASAYWPLGRRAQWRFGGFHFDNSGSLMVASWTPGAAEYSYSGYTLTVPMWFPFLLSLIVPGARLAHRLRVRHRAKLARGFEVSDRVDR